MLDAIHPRTRVPLLLEDYDPAVQADVDAALVCYPHGASAPAVAALRERGVRVVDLSADFRLRDRAIYEDWYGEHGAPELFGDAVYGLPELLPRGDRGRGPRRQPGLLPDRGAPRARPAGARGAIGDVVIDAKSGVSGAGREPSATTHFVTVDENMTPYKVGGHRHTPEIEQELAAMAADAAVTFTPHLVPLAQGELVSCYVTPARPRRRELARALRRGLRATSRGSRSSTRPPGVHEVRETNFCRISVHVDARTGRMIVFSAIDNLWKGALAGGPEPQPDVRARTRARGWP